MEAHIYPFNIGPTSFSVTRKQATIAIMPNICALFQRIADAMDYSTLFQC